MIENPTGPTMFSNTTDETEDRVRQIVSEYAAEQRRLWDELIERERRLANERAQLRERIDGLNAFLQTLGLETIEVDGEPSGTGTGFATPGNRRSDMPPRRERFAGVSLGNAIETILSCEDELHVDDIARRVYAVDEGDDIRRVKRTLNSALAIGVKRGQWERSGTARYRALDIEKERAVETGLALSSS